MLRIVFAVLALTATPCISQEVNIYSHRQPSLLKPIVDEFTKETGIPVNVAFVDRGMTERLVAEGNRSPADLVLTVDIARLTEVVAAGVTQPVRSAVLEAAIPEGFRDPGGQWFALTSRARVVYASLDRVAEGEVTTYEALADPKWRGRLCTRSGLHDYTLALTAAFIAHHGPDATREWLTALKANLAHRPQGQDVDQAKSIWAGECDIALGNTYYVGQMLNNPRQKEWAESLRVIFPTFEGGGTHLNVSGVAMTRAAPHKDTALKFMEFLVSDEAQRIYAETNHEFPVKPGVPSSALVQGWGSFTPDDLSLTDIATHRPEALRLMEEVNFDG